MNFYVMTPQDFTPELLYVMADPSLEVQNGQSPIASLQQTLSTLAGHSAVPRGTKVARMNANRAIQIAAPRRVYEVRLCFSGGDLTANERWALSLSLSLSLSALSHSLSLSISLGSLSLSMGSLSLSLFLIFFVFFFFSLSLSR